MRADRLDRMRGSLMAGAMGDALGYPVEFLDHKTIISRYGTKGITRFTLDRSGKSLVSDDTQMTLFTANGLLTAVCRSARDWTEDVRLAYLDWYYTQTMGSRTNDRHTWLRDLPELAHRRAPGITCMGACERLLQGMEPDNTSKGCGGIMRVAPFALLLSGLEGRGLHPYTITQMGTLGAELARLTHKHPLGFLPAALLTHLLYEVILMDVETVRKTIQDMALRTIDVLDTIYVGAYASDKQYLGALTRLAVELATNDQADACNIRRLGEGWTGEEAWAIALYCAVRHVDSVEHALIAAVNHDGDSDSTGSICGNIMGAIYGYEALERDRLFCPDDRTLKDTLELSSIILTMADDLHKGYFIGDCLPADTPEKQQWLDRYGSMKPVGV